MRKPLIFIIAIAIATALYSFYRTTEDPAGTTVTLLTHDSFLLSDSVIEDFESETGINLEIVSAGDAGSVLAGAALSAGSPTADVIFGVDNTLLAKALDAEIYESYRSPGLVNVQNDLSNTYGDLVTPIDFGDVCINFDNALENPPTSLDDLSKPEFRGLTVVTDPASSSPGLAFMLASISKYGEGWLDYWKALKANDLEVVSSWSDAYFVEFTKGGGDGSYPIVLSYASSPAAEWVYAEAPKPETVSTSAMADGCFRQIEYAGILRGTDNRAGAEAVIDWLLSKDVQEDIPFNMFVYPVNTKAIVDPKFIEFAPFAPQPLLMDVSEIAENLDTWLSQWDAVMKN